MINPQQINQVKNLILIVGEYIRTERKSFNNYAVEHKDVYDMVSYVDKTSEQKLIEGLEIILPGSSFLAEETGETHTNSTYQWIIDPLDGTTNFIHNIPHYCISIALLQNGITVAGWVYEVCTNELYEGIKNEGATLNNKKITVSKTFSVQQSLFATGFPVRKYDKLNQYLQLQQWVVENSRGIRRLGTAAYDLCLVAGGRVEGFYEPGLSAWDVAAGALIVTEAGGKVSSFSGDDNYIFGKEILATNGLVHDEVLKMVENKMK